MDVVLGFIWLTALMVVAPTIVWVMPAIIAFKLARRTFAKRQRALIAILAGVTAFVLLNGVGSFTMFGVAFGWQLHEWMPAFTPISILGFLVFLSLAYRDVLGMKST